MTEREVRLENTNCLIQTISEHGRHFFRRPADGQISRFVIGDNGRLYYRDKLSAQLLPVSHTKSTRWGRYFSEGGTLKALVEALGQHIKTGKSLPLGHLGPWPGWYCKGDPWGYGDDMKKVQASAVALGIVSITETAQ